MKTKRQTALLMMMVLAALVFIVPAAPAEAGVILRGTLPEGAVFQKGAVLLRKGYVFERLDANRYAVRKVDGKRVTGNLEIRCAERAGKCAARVKGNALICEPVSCKQCVVSARSLTDRKTNQNVSPAVKAPVPVERKKDGLSGGGFSDLFTQIQNSIEREEVRGPAPEKVTRPEPLPVERPAQTGSQPYSSSGSGYGQTNSADEAAYWVEPSGQSTAEPAAEEEPAPDFADLVAQELDSLGQGLLVFNPPADMKVGVTDRVEARISKSLSADLTDGLRGRGVPRSASIKISSAMTMRLSGEGFDIEAFSQEDQLVTERGYSQWEWDVTPEKSGVHSLYLKVAVRIKVPGYGEESKEYPVYEREINVEVNPAYSVRQFLMTNWEWVISTIIGSGIFGWLMGRWRRRKKEGVGA